MSYTLSCHPFYCQIYFEFLCNKKVIFPPVMQLSFFNASTYSVMLHLLQVAPYECSSSTSGVVKCGVGNPLINTTGPLKLSFKESGNIFDSRFIYFSVQANSSSTELTPQDPLHFRVEVIKRAEISIIGYV